MRPLVRRQPRDEQALASELDRLQRKTVEPAQAFRAQHLFARPGIVAPVAVQEQKVIAIAACEQQVVQHHDHPRALPRFPGKPLQQGNLVQKVEMLQGFVHQVDVRSLGEQGGCAGTLALSPDNVV